MTVPTVGTVVVIVTYESAPVVSACIEAVLDGGGTPGIVVVDNASTDGSADRAAAFDGVRVVRNRENRGFAAAANQGVAVAGGDPVVLLNPDTRVLPGWLARLAGALEDPSVGVAGCKILEMDGETLQHVGGIVRANALTEHVGRGEVDRGQHDDRRDVEYVTGAAMALRRRTWEALGGLDPGYFPAYFEDLDLCWRVRELGLRVVVVPEARVLHVERASTRIPVNEPPRRGTHGRDGEPGSPGPAQGPEAELSSSKRDSTRGTAPPGRPSPGYLRAFHRNRLRFAVRNYTLGDLLCRFLPGELRWLLGARPRGQVAALARAYAAALPELGREIVRRVRPGGRDAAPRRGWRR